MGLFELLILSVFGFVVGAFGRLALPGPDPMGLFATTFVGIAGSVLGGVVGFVALGRPAGFLLSVVGAAAIVYVVRRSRGGSLTDPGTRRRLRR